MTVETDFEGTVVDGAYRVEKLFAKGGFSVVYRARRLCDDAVVAMKVLHIDGEVEAMMLERFTREARLVSQLRSPHTVRVHDWGQVDTDYLYMVMEYINGRSLHRQIRKHGAMTPRQAAEVGSQICDSLVEAHEHGFLHRDLKPSNVMLFLNAEGRVVVKLLDFGVAKILDPEDDFRGYVTRQGSFVGTPRYASPEQLRREPLTAAADIYGVGMVLWECLVGDPAVPDSAYSEAVKHHLDSRPWRIPEWVDCPPEFAAIVEKTLAKVPDQRYESCVDLKLALDRWLAARFGAATGPQPRVESRSTENEPALGRGENTVMKKKSHDGESLSDLEAEDELFGEAIARPSEEAAAMKVMESHDLSESSAARASRMQIAKRNAKHSGIEPEDRIAASAPANTVSSMNIAATIGILVLAVLAALYVFTLDSEEAAAPAATLTEPMEQPAAAASAVKPPVSDEGRGDGTPTLPADTIVKGLVASGWRVGAKSTDKMDEVVQTNVLAERNGSAASVVIYESETWEWADQLKLSTEPPVQAVSFGRTIVRISPGPESKSNGVPELRNTLDEFRVQARERLANP